MSELLDPQIYRSVLEGLPTGVYLVDRQRKILFWNHGAERISGFLAQEVLGRCCGEDILGHCNADDSSACARHCPLSETMRDGQPRETELFLRHKQGHRVSVRVRSVPLRNQSGLIIGAAESFDEHRFASDRERSPNSPEAFELFSRSTGLPSNAVTADVLRQQLEIFAERFVPLSVLRIHVDRFVRFRADHGLEAADEMLKVVAQTMRNAVQPGDFLGCWADSEFLAIIASHRRRALQTISERIRTMVASSAITWWGDRVSLTVSVGSAVVQSGDTIESLIQRADNALDECIEKGGNRTILFSHTRAQKADPCL